MRCAAERASVVVINGPAITVDMFGNVVKGKINVDNISRAHITNTLYTNTCAPTPASSGAMETLVMAAMAPGLKMLTFRRKVMVMTVKC